MNNVSTAPLIIGSVILSALAQIALKGGMSSATVQSYLSSPLRLTTMMHIICQPMIALGLAFYVASAAIWLAVLARMEVSSAYPYVALAIVLTSLLGWLIFNDSFSSWKIAGTLLIVLGVLTLARS